MAAFAQMAPADLFGPVRPPPFSARLSSFAQRSAAELFGQMFAMMLESREPAVGLFADQEIRLIDGPLFVGEDYVLRREIAALSQSKRTESYWARTHTYDSAGKRQVAEMLLNHATLKHSFAGYADGVGIAG